MKKLFIVIACLPLMFTACNNKEEKDAELNSLRDSLQQIITQRDNEIDDLMATFNDIQEGFRLINEAEGRITTEGEGVNQGQRIKENVVFIAQKMQENRQLIAKLRKQLKDSKFNSEQLNKTIESLTAQLQEKEQLLQQLREELDNKDIHISELDETIANLNTDVSELKEKTEQQSQTISTQDKNLNTAWYAFGTKSELKEQGIIAKGEVSINSSNKSYFTKIDIRNTTEIKLYSKSAELLTVHPSGSYTLTTDANKQYVLNITNPQQFWSTSKYLVLQVK